VKQKYTICSIEETKVLENKSYLLTGRSEYPWTQISIGESFIIETSPFKKYDYRPTVPVALKRLGWEFKTMKTIDSEGRKVVMVKRVA